MHVLACERDSAGMGGAVRPCSYVPMHLCVPVCVCTCVHKCVRAQMCASHFERGREIGVCSISGLQLCIADDASADPVGYNSLAEQPVAFATPNTATSLFMVSSSTKVVARWIGSTHHLVGLTAATFASL
jgi:hypothetical protein